MLDGGCRDGRYVKTGYFLKNAILCNHLAKSYQKS